MWPQAVTKTKSVLIRLRVTGKSTAADVLEKILEKMEAALLAKGEANAARKRRNTIDADETARHALHEASNEAAQVSAAHSFYWKTHAYPARPQCLFSLPT